MAGLAVQNFVSAAVGMAVLAAVIRGFASRGEHGARQLLAGPDPLAPLHPAAALDRRRARPRLPGRRSRRSPAPTASRRSAASTRRSRSARSPRRSRSSSSAPTAAASSTSTPPSRSRTRPASPTSSRSLFILLIPAAATAQFGRMVGNRRQGWALYAAMIAMLVGGDRRRLRRRAARLAGPARGRDRDRRRRRHHRRQPRGQGAALRHRRLDPVGGDHHGRLQRLGQLRPRLLHRPRRRRAAGQHDDRRGGLRRGRLRPLRDAALRPARGLHRRA